MKRKFFCFLIVAIMLFACMFALSGCADYVQSNCDHVWVLQKNSSSLKDATCSEEGISAVYNCIKCQKTKFEHSPKIPHTFNENDNVLVYSCKSSNTYIKQKCTVCGDIISKNIPITIHKLGAPVYHEATESDCAYTERKCSQCPYSEIVWQHALSEINQNLYEQMVEEAKVSGNCGSVIAFDCDYCKKETVYFLHEYEESEVIFSSSELVIKKLVCNICNDDFKYEVEFL